MSNIMERLRVLASGRTMTYDTGHIADGYDPMQAMGEAADEIERLREALFTASNAVDDEYEKVRDERDRLREENNKLRAALERRGEAIFGREGD